MRKKTSKEFGCILTHEQEKFIKDGKTRDNALKAFKAKAYGDERLTQFILLECLVTLRDYFGFGRKRALRFKECFEKKCQLIAEDWTSWADQAWIVATELGIEFPKDIQAEFEKRSGETR